MTREEAIGYLKCADSTFGRVAKTKTAEALEIAIEALEQEPCEDAISRQSVRHILNHEVKMPIKVWKKLFELVDCLPPVTSQPKTGHWKYIGNGHNGLFECDNCGAHRNMFDELEKYCYDCGANMIELHLESEEKE